MQSKGKGFQSLYTKQCKFAAKFACEALLHSCSAIKQNDDENIQLYAKLSLQH